ncbi:NADP oxidoreductase coenzyme F420-dependent [Striga asiatica]|uniref:NADP oxidoreductase coenzyme F420-dependent n=1 Tax=Striga asiatica TaxID=4170 RepID=A0A5A7Q8L5_STRAF|nr:NADP oxidoreductase coenzyme F420-dependent [Striga asiatica]
MGQTGSGLMCCLRTGQAGRLESAALGRTGRAFSAAIAETYHAMGIVSENNYNSCRGAALPRHHIGHAGTQSGSRENDMGVARSGRALHCKGLPARAMRGRAWAVLGRHVAARVALKSVLKKIGIDYPDLETLRYTTRTPLLFQNFRSSVKPTGQNSGFPLLGPLASFSSSSQPKKLVLLLKARMLFVRWPQR